MSQRGELAPFSLFASFFLEESETCRTSSLEFRPVLYTLRILDASYMQIMLVFATPLMITIPWVGISSTNNLGLQKHMISNPHPITGDQRRSPRGTLVCPETSRLTCPPAAVCHCRPLPHSPSDPSSSHTSTDALKNNPTCLQTKVC